ncbi:MAG: hypothetical protein R3C24_02560 [Cyanobacteriota/Melainabacteria group bacterium]
MSLSTPKTDLGAGERLRCLQPIEVGSLKGSRIVSLSALGLANIKIALESAFVRTSRGFLKKPVSPVY